MQRRLQRAIVPLVLAAGVTAGARARADTGLPLDLDWSAPAECPKRATVLAEIARLVGPDPGGGPDHARVSARAVLSRGKDGWWHIHITTLGEGGGERDLDATSCAAVTEATVLVLALRIKPGLAVERALPVPPGPTPSPAPTPPPADATPPTEAPHVDALPPLEPPPPRREIPVRRAQAKPVAEPAAIPAGNPSSPRFFVGALVLGTAGELPSPDVSGEVAAGYAWGRLRGELHGEAGLVQHASASDGGAAVHAAGGGLRACYAALVPPQGSAAPRGLSVYACADAEIDAMWASGYDVATPLNTSAGWFTLGVGVTASWRLSRRFALRGDLEGLAPFDRPRFVTDEPTGASGPLVYTPFGGWGRIALGADVYFF